MSRDVEQWVGDVVASANADDRFAGATEQFDGSITFEIGPRTLWLKVYRGEIIDTERYVPMIGTTFSVVGDSEDWAQLVQEEVSLAEQLYDGNLTTSGNRIEANRMRESVELLVRYMQDLDWEAIE
jgi:putative sterol carrier protein